MASNPGSTVTVSGFIIDSGAVLSAPVLSGPSELHNLDRGTPGRGGNIAVDNGGAAAATLLLATSLEALAGGRSIDPVVPCSKEIVAAMAPGVAVASSTAEIGLGRAIGDIVINLQLTGDSSNDYFMGDASFGDGACIEVERAAPCYCPGTLILTEYGERPIEQLRIGDRLVTRDATLRPIRWIGHRSYDGRFLSGRHDILPVTFAPGSLGENADGQAVPCRPLTVSPMHAMFLDGALVPAGALVDGRGIFQAQSVNRLDYIHLELDSHDVIVAEGALSESFADDGSRAMFQNAHEYDLLYPDEPVPRPCFCAPRVEEGDRLDAIRQKLSA